MIVVAESVRYRYVFKQSYKWTERKCLATTSRQHVGLIVSRRLTALSCDMLRRRVRRCCKILCSGVDPIGRLPARNARGRADARRATVND